jgi:putative hemolysin
MNIWYELASAALLAVLTLGAYMDRVYSEMGKFLAREYQDNIDSWETMVEPRLRLSRESIRQAALLLRQLTLAVIALLSGIVLASHLAAPGMSGASIAAAVGRTAVWLVLTIVIFDLLIPQLLFSRTRGRWPVRIVWLLQALIYMVLPVALLQGLLVSIAALAEPEDAVEPEDTSEAMDALLEAGEEEGILEESDRQLVRSVVQFGDMVVREVMTPRPEIFAVPEEMTLAALNMALTEHAFSRVPVYSGSIDIITGIAFAHDLLRVEDSVAPLRTVALIQRAAAFVPETKRVAELLREMQREKQHMRLVIDEYGGVAGLVTIEDLLEAIVGEIADEHDETAPDDVALPAEDGSYTLSGSFELTRLRGLLRQRIEAEAQSRNRYTSVDEHVNEDAGTGDESAEGTASNAATSSAGGPAAELPEPLQSVGAYEATTLGGLVSELAGHIPLPGEVVEEDGLRLEVLASTDRRVETVRVSLTASSPGEVTA